MASKSYSNNFMSKKGKYEEAHKDGEDVLPNTKRSAENSPGGDSKKRSILGDVTNVNKGLTAYSKNAPVKAQFKFTIKIPAVENCGMQEEENGVGKSSEMPKMKKNKICTVTEEKSENTKQEASSKMDLCKDYSKAGMNEVDSNGELCKGENSKVEECQSNSKVEKCENGSKMELTTFHLYERPKVPSGVEDFDDECSEDQLSEPHYAPYIFEYYKEREKMFTIEKYMDRQIEMNELMRAILIDWMVEVQESFELNHETLYLGVKLVDMYFAKYTVPKAKIQLVGATAALIASKYDERIPPLIDDFLYICDDSYTREELLSMEYHILKTVSFDLGIPISYRFLRRYARCSKTSMDVLTLARYILETSLLDYELIDVHDSKLGAAALLLAFKMKGEGNWSATLEYYSGYTEDELMKLVKCLNKGISPPVKKQLVTIKKKYSHRIFFEVAKIPVLSFD